MSSSQIFLVSHLDYNEFWYKSVCIAVLYYEIVKACSETVFVRDKSSANMDKFLENLQNVNWSHLNRYADSQQCYSSFVNDNCFPYKKIKRSDRRFNKPWISLGLLKSIKKKNKLFKTSLSNPSNHTKVHYKRYKSKLNYSLWVPKRLYCDKKFEESKSNVKATWRLPNKVINKTKAKSKLNRWSGNLWSHGNWWGTVQ